MRPQVSFEILYKLLISLVGLGSQQGSPDRLYESYGRLDSLANDEAYKTYEMSKERSHHRESESMSAV